MAQLPPPRPLRPLQCPARTVPAGRGPGTKAASARAPHPSGLRRLPALPEFTAQGCCGDRAACALPPLTSEATLRRTLCKEARFFIR